MKFKPSNAKLNKPKQRFPQQWSSLLKATATIFQLKIEEIASKQCWFWVILWDGVISLHHFLSFHYSRSILPFWWAFLMAVIICWSKVFPPKSPETLSYINTFHILIRQNPHNPKLLFFSWHVAEWAVRSFFSEQLESTRIPLCLSQPHRKGSTQLFEHCLFSGDWPLVINIFYLFISICPGY